MYDIQDPKFVQEIDQGFDVFCPDAIHAIWQCIWLDTMHSRRENCRTNWLSFTWCNDMRTKASGINHNSETIVFCVRICNWPGHQVHRYTYIHIYTYMLYAQPAKIIMCWTQAVIYSMFQAWLKTRHANQSIKVILQSRSTVSKRGRLQV